MLGKEKGETSSFNKMWQDKIWSNSQKRKIKVGYMSSDLCNHPVGRFILPIIEYHKSSDVEVVCISNTNTEDSIQERIKSQSSEWLDIRRMDDITAARRILDKEIDILVELGGYTADSRISVLRFKPCRIQLSYLGYFAPTYLRCIDGWIGDTELFAGLNKVQKDAHRLLNIKGGYMCYREKNFPKIKSVDRGRKFRFGSFNHARKLTSDTLELYNKVLRSTDNSMLVLKSLSFAEESERERVRRMLEKHEIDPGRVEIMRWIKGRDKHIDCYNYIDVALDPIPYGGATTTCEALVMGIPVITLRGDGMIGRLSSSILTSANCEH